MDTECLKLPTVSCYAVFTQSAEEGEGRRFH